MYFAILEQRKATVQECAAAQDYTVNAASSKITGIELCSFFAVIGGY